MSKRSSTAAVLAAILLAAPLAYGQDTKGKAAAPAAGGKDLFPPLYFDVMIKERTAAGQPDTPQLREAVREELNTRELIVREAKKKGMEKDPALKAAMDLTSQTVLVRAYLQDYVKNHPPSEDDLRKEYERIKGQLGDKEYKARHILVDKEEDAKDVIVLLQKGEQFEKLAERSKDNGSRANGGDLGWASPANYVKPFSDAMTSLDKGKFTPQPVRTQFGWHVILLEDVREAQIPPFEQVKPQLIQQMQPKIVDAHLRDLRAKANGK